MTPLDTMIADRGLQYRPERARYFVQAVLRLMRNPFMGRKPEPDVWTAVEALADRIERFYFPRPRRAGILGDVGTWELLNSSQRRRALEWWETTHVRYLGGTAGGFIPGVSYSTDYSPGLWRALLQYIPAL